MEISSRLVISFTLLLIDAVCQVSRFGVTDFEKVTDMEGIANGIKTGNYDIFVFMNVPGTDQHVQSLCDLLSNKQYMCSHSKDENVLLVYKATATLETKAFGTVFRAANAREVTIAIAGTQDGFFMSPLMDVLTETYGVNDDRDPDYVLFAPNNGMPKIYYAEHLEKVIKNKSPSTIGSVPVEQLEMDLPSPSTKLKERPAMEFIQRNYKMIVIVLGALIALFLVIVGFLLWRARQGPDIIA